MNQSLRIGRPEVQKRYVLIRPFFLPVRLYFNKKIYFSKSQQSSPNTEKKDEKLPIKSSRVVKSKNKVCFKTLNKIARIRFYLFKKCLG